VRRRDQTAREDGGVAELEARCRKAPAGWHERPESLRTRDPVLQPYLLDRQKLVEQEVLELEVAPARILEYPVRVGEEERLLAVGVPQPRRERPVGDGGGYGRNLALDLAGGDVRLPAPPADLAEHEHVGRVRQNRTSHQERGEATQDSSQPHHPHVRPPNLTVRDVPRCRPG